MRVVLTPEKNWPSNRRSRPTRARSQTATSRVPALVLADDGVRLRRAMSHSRCYLVSILGFGKTEAMVATHRFFGWVSCMVGVRNRRVCLGHRLLWLFSVS